MVFSVRTSRRLLAATAMSAALVLSVSACGDDDDGSDPTGSPSTGVLTGGTSEPPDDNSGPLDVSGFDPCTALSADQLTGLGLPATGQEDRADDGTFCAFSQDSRRVVVALGDGAPEKFGEDDEDRPEPQKTSYEGRDGFTLSDNEACGYLFEATGNQTVAVLAADDAADHCELAEQVLDLVLAELG